MNKNNDDKKPCIDFALRDGTRKKIYPGQSLVLEVGGGSGGIGIHKDDSLGGKSKSHEWISAQYQLPRKHYGYDNNKNDILFSYVTEILIGYYDGMSFISNGKPYPIKLSYWMPLPNPPKIKDK